MIRLIASDIDGTLVEEGSGKLPERLFSAIEALGRKGILFAAASGRQYLGLRRLFAPVAEQIIFISENGANVVSQGKQIFASVMEDAVVKEVQAYVRTLPDCYLTMSTTGAMYSNGANDAAYRKKMVEDYHSDMVFSDDIHTEELEVIKMAVYCKKGIGALAANMEQMWSGRLNVVTGGENWIDVINQDTDKGTALQLLQSRFGITKEETMAFGDNHNDIGMLRAAGESYAVETARTAVKNVAKHRADNYEKQGVIRILETLAAI